MDNKVKPYSEYGSKKTQVAEMFDNIASAYDFNNQILSLGIDRIWRNILVSTIEKTNPRYILDVATGTGDVAIRLAKKIHSAKVTGIDLSENMLHIGRNKVMDQNLTDRIILLKGDSEHLDFEDDSFDAITVAFGVRNFETLEKGLSEILRVLKPGGMLGILEFSKPSNRIFAFFFNLYFKTILPLAGSITSKDNQAYKYLYESVQAFPEGENFLKILESTGYQKSKCRKLSFGICSLYTAYK